MHRCHRFGLCGAVFLWSLHSLAQTVPQAEGQAKSLERAARHFVEQLRTGQVDAAYRRLGPKMKAAVSQDSFKKIWPNLVAQLGTLKKLEDARLEGAGAYQAVIITARFRKMRMDLQVVFNRDKAVEGFRVRPKTTTKSTMAATAKSTARPQTPQPPFSYQEKRGRI